MISQLQKKYRLSILSLLGVVSVLGIFPFVVVRYFEQKYSAALVDMALIIGIISLVGYALHSKKTRVASLAAAVFIAIGTVLMIIVNGLDSILWVYPVFAGTFFLAKPIEACSINLATGIALVVLSDIFTVIPLIPFVATTLVLSMCAFVYANQGVKLFRLLGNLNTIDALTGALNRRALSTDLAAAIANAERNGLQQLLVLLDMDHFKLVNDQYGHAVGDQVLQKFVSITSAHIRKYDRIYRYGGEEFVLLIPQIDPAQQHAFIESLRAVIKRDLATPDGKQVTLSVGIAAWVAGTTVDTWLKRADDALYLAKSSGRDCVVFSQD